MKIKSIESIIKANNKLELIIDFKLYFGTEKERNDFCNSVPRHNNMGIFTTNMSENNVVKFTVYIKGQEVSLNTVIRIKDIFKTYIEKVIEIVNQRMEINNVVKDLEPFIIA